ncbi:MAG: mechanosensitive ion channel [Spirosomataceae bacterium]
MEELRQSLNDFLNYELLRWSSFVLTPAKIILVLIVGGLTHLMLLLFKGFLNRQVKKRYIDLSVHYAIYQLTRYIAFVVALGVCLELLGFQLNFLIASTAALMVGVGIGLQHLFEDFISGIIILVDRTIKVNDVIKVEQVIGRVLAVKLRYTEVLTSDRYHLLIPNSKITRDIVINFTHLKTPVQFDIAVTVAYATNIRIAESLLLACAQEHPEVKNYSMTNVQVADFQESGVQLRLYFFAEDVFEIDTIKSDLRAAIIEKFQANQIVIPFPQREVYVRTT